MAAIFSIVEWTPTLPISRSQAGQSVESLVEPELRGEFETDKTNRFPQTEAAEQKAYDKRTPDLFKEEWSGAGIFGLLSKTY